MKNRIGCQDTFYVEHITVTTDKLLSTGNSDQWFEPVNPACITQVAIQYVEPTEKEFLEEPGCKANSFSDAFRVMGLSHSGICYNWDKNSRLLIADKAISAAKLPAHYDDLYRYFFAIK